MEPILPELDYSAAEPTQHAIVQRSYVTVQPVGDSYKTEGDLKFDIPACEQATALHESFLRIRCKIVKDSGDACNHDANTSPDDVSVVNNLLHSMWKQVTVSLNGHEVEKIDNYPYRAYVDALTSYSPEVLERRGELHGWSSDTQSAFSDLALTTAGKNVGLKTRSLPFKNSAVVELTGRIDSDVMNQGRSIPPNTSIQIVLARASNAFVLLSSSSTVKYKLLITEASLVVARDKLAPALHKVQTEMIKQYNLSIDYRHSKVLTFSVPQGETTHTIANAFKSATHLPDRFLAFFVTNAAFSGLQSSNPFNFEHFNLKHFYASINESAAIVPNDGYKPNFATKSYTNEYYALLRELDADNENHMISIKRQDFAGGYAIYPFRIVHRTRGGDVLGPRVGGSIGLHIEFTTALTSALTLVLLADYRGSFEIRESGDFAPCAPALQ